MATKKNKTDIPKNGHNIHGTKSVIGIVYSKESNLKVIRANETIHHGADAERIRLATDPRIRNRIYLQLKSGDSLPASGVGEGDNPYIAEINGIYDEKYATEQEKSDIEAEIAEDEKETDHTNRIESALLSRGYTGYLSGNIIVVLDSNIKVKAFTEDAKEEELETPKADVKQTKKTLPVAMTKHKLTKKDASALSAVLPALKAKAPSTTIKNNVLSVNDNEYGSFVKEAATFPNMPKFITDQVDNDTETDSVQTNRTSSKVGRLARQRNKKTQDKKLVDTIQKILLDDKFIKAFTGKISSTFENFQGESKKHQESKQAEHVTSEEAEAINVESNNLLTEIRDILTKLSDATTADDIATKDLARESLEKILESTKNNTEEEQQYITDAINTVLSEMRNEEVEDNLGIKTKEPFSITLPETKKNTETVNKSEFDRAKEQLGIENDYFEKPDGSEHLTNEKPEKSSEATKVSVENKEKLSPEITPLKTEAKPVSMDDEDWDTPLKDLSPKKVDQPELTPVEKQMEHMKETGETVPKNPKTPYEPKPKREPKHNTRIPVEIKEKVKPRDTRRTARETINAATGETTYTPNFEPVPKDLSTGDTLLGAIVNSRKDIVTKDKDGNELSRRASANKVEYTKKLARKADEYLGEGASMKALRWLKGKPKKESTDKKDSATKTLLGSSPSEPVQQRIEPTLEPVDNSSPLTDIAEIAASVPSKGGGLMSKAGSFLGKAGKFIGKAAAPLAAGAAVFGGVGDIADGKTIDSASDIIPEGGLLNKLNPFNYVMNAGRLAGNTWDKGYSAISKVAGGSGSLGSDIYNGVDNVQKLWDGDDASKAKEIEQKTMKLMKERAKTKVDLQPKFEKNDLKTETMEIAEAGKEKAIAETKPAESTQSQNIVSNVTNNSNPVQQIMPSNMMTQRNTESAFQSYNNRRFSM